MEHMMVDIESLGTSPGCVIISMAAVPFELNGMRREGKVWSIDIASSLYEGLFIQGETLTWWISQKPETLRKQQTDPLPLRHVLAKFAQYIEEERTSSLWAHGSTFDIPILDVAYRRVGFDTPWAYRGVRDTRTLFWLARLKGWEPRHAEKPSDKHDPKADCHRQVTWVLAALAVLEKGGPVE